MSNGVYGEDELYGGSKSWEPMPYLGRRPYVPTVDHKLPKSIRQKLNDAQVEELRRLISGFQISLSWAVTSTLNIIAEEIAGAGESKLPAWLDCQMLFFAFLSLGLDEKNAPHAKSSLPLDLVQSLGLEEDELNVIKHNYLQRFKRKGQEPIISSHGILTWDESFRYLFSVTRKIKDECTPQSKWVSARHLLAAFIQISSEGNNIDFESVGLGTSEAIEALVRNCEIPKNQKEDSKRGWAAFFARHASAQFKNGQNHDFSRECEERHAALRVDEYASTFAQFFTSAGNEECCIAVFAPWGRGKSFLMKRVKAKLKSFGYDTITFQAWKYPTRPEVWVHFYETMSRNAFDCEWWKKWPRVFRTGVARHGFVPMILALLILGIAMYPKLHLAAQAASWMWTLIVLFGIGSVIWIIIFYFSVKKTIKKISERYLQIPSHSEKLGLQAAIGDDLADLFEGWMPSKRCPGIFPILAFVAVLYLIFQGARHWGSFVPLGFLPGSWGMGAMLPWLISGFLLSAGVWLMSWFGEPKRILLVVDDLDRCSLDHLISVMESIKLLIEDKKVSRRLQVAMLVEEEVLMQAILQKYEPLRDSKGGSMTDKRIIRESFEKLFTVHLRLEPLNANDAEELLSRMFSTSKLETNIAEEEVLDQAEDQLMEPLEVEKLGEEGSENVSASGDGKKGQIIKNTFTRPSKHGKSKQDASEASMRIAHNPQSLPKFSLIEEGFLIAAVRDLVESRAADVVGPRTVRNFVFRYQLARLLLNQLKVQFEPYVLVQALVGAMTNNSECDKPSREILQVVNQIS